MAGMPFEVTVEAGQEFFQIIEVSEPNSIVYTGFETATNDIGFGLYRVREESAISREETHKH